MAEIVAAQYDIEIVKGRKNTYSLQFYTDNTLATKEDLSAYTAQAQARESEDPTSTEICTFTIDATNKATGLFLVTINDKAKAITQNHGTKGFWDFVLIDGSSDPITYAFGYATVVDRPTVVT